ncbi:MAG: CPBP family intramembrane metalloprotease [Planctomycetes bacterium]|nr:CPBP family intramembrane metalloprotease [Planctomycetota bacterium]
MLVLVAGYVAAELEEIPKRWLVPAVLALVAGYGVLVRLRGRETWRDFGLRADNLARSAFAVGLFTAAGALLCVLWALISGRPLWRPELALLLPAYPLYGIVQQLVFQGVLHRRLVLLLPGRFLPIAVTASVFALVHVGNAPLVPITLAAGAGWSWLYRRWPNVWVLGISHGILASLAYPLVLSQDPLGGL